ncbi:MAG: patatin-like phospholipase family protein [Ferruginibacter sp.]
MKYAITLFLLIVCIGSMAQQNGTRPRIGLTLSGGGAKGLAHIGILKAIDSAGLNIDYVTGTSMGGIIGALYSVGYSGKEIEELQKDIDWDVLFSNNIPLSALSMEEKDQYSRYAIELPFINNKVRLKTGLINGQEISLKFSELFFHVYNIRNFNDLHIPFKCMATDLETGKLVVLDTGSITAAIRATMAIPTVFFAVQHDDRKLVDGGLVRNFPVKNVKEMGADIVIGSNVTAGLSKIDQIRNPVDVLTQMAFYKEADDFKEEVPLTNVYIHMPMEKYNTSSFGSAKEIMQIGIKTGEAYYPVFKKLADSINALGPSPGKPDIPFRHNAVFITEYKVNGLRKTSVPFFAHMMNFDDHRFYTAAQITKSIRKAYGSRYYSSITYVLEPTGRDSARIIFTAEENPSTFLKGSLYYTRFRGINVNINLTTRDFIIPNSRSSVAVSLGESIQLETEHLQYMGRVKTVAFLAGFRLDNQKIDAYNNFRVEGAFRQSFSRVYLNFQNSGNNKWTTGLGAAFDYVHYNPTIHARVEAKGSFTSFKTYLYFKYNSLNQIFYPTRGLKLSTELAYVSGQDNNIRFYEDGVQTNNLNFDNYPRLMLDGSLYSSLGNRFTFFTDLQAGINFTAKQNILNNFQIGGINGSFRNQVRFAGLQEATVNSSSVAALMLGLRYSPANNMHIIGRVNGLIKDFATGNRYLSTSTFLTGYSLTFGYRTPIGPLELSAMYSDQSKRLEPYVMFGIPF